MTKGILDMRQFNVANNIKNRMIDIYDRSTDLETQRFLAEKASNDALLENTKHKKIAEAYAKMASNPKIA